jgi:hypothetical protein
LYERKREKGRVEWRKREEEWERNYDNKVYSFMVETSLDDFSMILSRKLKSKSGNLNHMLPERERERGKYRRKHSTL